MRIFLEMLPLFQSAKVSRGEPSSFLQSFGHLTQIMRHFLLLIFAHFKEPEKEPALSNIVMFSDGACGAITFYISS